MNAFIEQARVTSQVAIGLRVEARRITAEAVGLRQLPEALCVESHLIVGRRPTLAVVAPLPSRASMLWTSAA